MILEINDITKSFGAVEVLKGVSMSVDSAQCYGLVGDNGAGKSTMLKVLSGVHRPDSGEIRLEDRVMDFNAEIGARLAGIEMIFQDLALCDDLILAQDNPELRTRNPERPSETFSDGHSLAPNASRQPRFSP